MKKGFTLAEVLITLAILGIIAAVTIPSIYQKYQRRITVTKVKKMYTNLTNAYSSYIAENRINKVYNRSESGAEEIFNDFIKPYFYIKYNAGTKTENKQKIMTDAKQLKSNALVNYTSSTNYYAVQLKDGSVIFFRGHDIENSNQSCNFVVFYDVNGKKEPNVIGKDLFFFCPIGENMYPGASIDMKDFTEKHCLSENANGFGCVDWIIAKGNMDYLDCPDKLTWEKDKFK